MTQKDFENAVSVFDDAEAFICTAYVEDGLSISFKGPKESVIEVEAAQVIIDEAKGSSNPLHHLIVASSLLHSTMLVSQRKKDKAIAEAKEKAPEAAATLRAQSK